MSSGCPTAWPVRRKNQLSAGMPMNWLATSARTCRGRECSVKTAVLIIVPSQGRTPAWLATSKARPDDGTCSTPVVSTLQ